MMKICCCIRDGCGEPFDASKPDERDPRNLRAFPYLYCPEHRERPDGPAVIVTNQESDFVTIGKKFAELLRAELSPEDWESMRELNATPKYAGDVCASHDFCDANMVMHAAFIALGLRSIVEIDENAEPEAHAESIALWGRAWDWAKENELTATEGKTC